MVWTFKQVNFGSIQPEKKVIRELSVAYWKQISLVILV